MNFLQLRPFQLSKKFAHAPSLLRQPWEFYVLQLFLYSILMPVAFQSSLAGMSAIFYFWKRGGLALNKEWAGHDKAGLSILCQQVFRTFTWIWILHLCLAGAESLSGLASEFFKVWALHLRLLLKTAFYGYIIIKTMFYLSFRLRQKNASGPQLHILSLLGFTSLYLLYMIGQRYYGWDWIHGFQAQLDEDRYAYGVYRSSGFMGHPLTLAFNAMIFCLFCFGQGLYLARSRLDSARLWILQSGLVFLIVSLSGSRYPTILTLILLLLATLYQFKQSHAERRLQFFGLLTAVAACFCALFFFDLPMWGRMAEFWDASQTMEQRFDRLVFWKVHLQLGLQAPFFGVGLLHYKDILFEAYNQFGFAELEHKYNAHNMYLQNFAEFGLLGLISLAVFLGGLVRIGWRFWQHSKNISLVLLSLGVITGALMQNTLRDSEYLFGLWFCIAAVGILYQESVHPSRN